MLKYFSKNTGDNYDIRRDKNYKEIQDYVESLFNEKITHESLFEKFLENKFNIGDYLIRLLYPISYYDGETINFYNNEDDLYVIDFKDFFTYKINEGVYHRYNYNINYNIHQKDKLDEYLRNITFSRLNGYELFFNIESINIKNKKIYKILFINTKSLDKNSEFFKYILRIEKLLYYYIYNFTVLKINADTRISNMLNFHIYDLAEFSELSSWCTDRKYVKEIKEQNEKIKVYEGILNGKKILDQKIEELKKTNKELFIELNTLDQNMHNLLISHNTSIYKHKSKLYSKYSLKEDIDLDLDKRIYKKISDIETMKKKYIENNEKLMKDKDKSIINQEIIKLEKDNNDLVQQIKKKEEEYIDLKIELNKSQIIKFDKDPKKTHEIEKYIEKLQKEKLNIEKKINDELIKNIDKINIYNDILTNRLNEIEEIIKENIDNNNNIEKLKSDNNILEGVNNKLSTIVSNKNIKSVILTFMEEYNDELIEDIKEYKNKLQENINKIILNINDNKTKTKANLKDLIINKNKLIESKLVLNEIQERLDNIIKIQIPNDKYTSIKQLIDDIKKIKKDQFKIKKYELFIYKFYEENIKDIHNISEKISAIKSADDDMKTLLRMDINISQYNIFNIKIYNNQNKLENEMEKLRNQMNELRKENQKEKEKEIEIEKLLKKYNEFDKIKKKKEEINNNDIISNNDNEKRKKELQEFEQLIVNLEEYDVLLEQLELYNDYSKYKDRLQLLRVNEIISQIIIKNNGVDININEIEELKKLISININQIEQNKKKIKVMEFNSDEISELKKNHKKLLKLNDEYNEKTIKLKKNELEIKKKEEEIEEIEEIKNYIDEKNIEHNIQELYTKRKSLEKEKNDKYQLNYTKNYEKIEEINQLKKNYEDIRKRYINEYIRNFKIKIAYKLKISKLGKINDLITQKITDHFENIFRSDLFALLNYYYMIKESILNKMNKKNLYKDYNSFIKHLLIYLFYSMSKNLPAFKGGSNKKYQLFISNRNKYFINHNNKKIYLKLSNIYVKNNKLYIIINKYKYLIFW